MVLLTSRRASDSTCSGRGEHLGRAEAVRDDVSCHAGVGGLGAAWRGPAACHQAPLSGVRGAAAVSGSGVRRCGAEKPHAATGPGARLRRDGSIGSLPGGTCGAAAERHRVSHARSPGSTGPRYGELSSHATELLEGRDGECLKSSAGSLAPGGSGCNWMQLLANPQQDKLCPRLRLEIIVFLVGNEVTWVASNGQPPPQGHLSEQCHVPASGGGCQAS